MDVTLPDGTVIEGVPEGTTKAELQAKLARKAPGSEPLPSIPSMGADITQGALTGAKYGGLPGMFIGATGPIGKHALDAYDRLAYKTGGSVTDAVTRMEQLQRQLKKPDAPEMPSLAPAAGFAANVGVQAAPTIIGQQAGKLLTPLMEKAGVNVMGRAVNPSAADLESGAAKKAIGDMLAEKVWPTPAGMEKAHRITTQMHGQVQGPIAKSVAEVPLEPIEQKFLEQYTKAIPQGEDAVKEVINTWKNFSTSPAVAGSPSMTTQMADVLKRGLQESARANYGKPTGEAEKALAAHVRQGLMEANPEIAKPLAREASMMNVLDVAERSALKQGNKNIAGLALLAKNPKAGAAMLADRSPFWKSLLAQMLYSGSEIAPQGAGAAAGAYIGHQSGKAP